MGASVYLIPSDGDSERIHFAGGDASGHYLIPGVPPGDYRIFAWAAPPKPQEILSGVGSSLTLGASEHRIVALEAAESSDASGQRDAQP